MLSEGETTALTLFRLLSGPTRPVTVTLTIKESERQYLSVSPAQIRINEKGGTATVSITAFDNEDVAHNPVNIRLSVAGDNARTTPTETIAVTIEDNDVYIIGFEHERIALEEGGESERAAGH